MRPCLPAELFSIRQRYTFTIYLYRLRLAHQTLFIFGVKGADNLGLDCLNLGFATIGAIGKVTHENQKGTFQCFFNSALTSSGQVHSTIKPLYQHCPLSLSSAAVSWRHQDNFIGNTDRESNPGRMGGKRECYRCAATTLPRHISMFTLERNFIVRDNQQQFHNYTASQSTIDSLVNRFI